MTTATRAPAPLTVLLPAVPALPDDLHGRPYTVGPLLGAGDSNAKLAKSDRGSREHRYITHGLSLAPDNVSGRPMCPCSSPGCRAECLDHQGRGRMLRTTMARVAKTVASTEHRAWFAARLRWELEAAFRRARKEGLKVAVRLNVFSGQPFEAVFPWLFDYPACFYDDTKALKRALRSARGKGWPDNYHLTFSRSEGNGDECRRALDAGVSVAVVFRGKPLPEPWHGRRVIDGDRTDLRFLDPRGLVVGLTAKGTAKEDGTGFVVDVAAGGPGKTDLSLSPRPPPATELPDREANGGPRSGSNDAHTSRRAPWLTPARPRRRCLCGRRTTATPAPSTGGSGSGAAAGAGCSSCRVRGPSRRRPGSISAAGPRSRPGRPGW
jgi:hypothetical protein